MAGFAAVFLILAIAGILFYRGQHQRLQTEAIETLKSIAELKSREIIEWRRERLADSTVNTENTGMLRLLQRWAATGDSKSASEIIEQFEFLEKGYRYLGVHFVNPQGKADLSSSGKTGFLHDEAVEALKAAALERHEVLTRFHLDPETSVPHIGAVVPVFSSDTADAPLLGAVVFEIDPRTYLYPLIMSWPTPSPSAETILVTRDGNDVLFLNELRHRKDTALKLRIPLSRKEVPASMAVSGREGVVEGLDYRGVPVLAVLMNIPGSDWSMVSKIDRAEAFSGWRLRAALIIGLVLAMIAAAAAAFLLFWQRGIKAHYRALHKAETALNLSEARYRTTLISIGDGVIVTDTSGKIVFINPTAERLTGWRRHEARGLPLEKIFTIINEETRAPVENPVQRVLREGLVVGLANHTLLLSRDGREIPIADSGAPIRHKDGPISGVVLVFSDQSSERLVEHEARRNIARLQALIETLQHQAGSVQEYLDYALEEAIRLTQSKIGYIYHYHPERREFVLNTWSRDVMKECSISNPPSCYELDKTGIWGEAVRQRRPIILNDFPAEHPLKKGYPEGHAPLLKYLTVPVLRGGEIVGVVGVANKETDYTDADVLQLSLLMESAWRIVDRIEAEEALRRSEAKFRSVFEAVNVGKSLTLFTGEVVPNAAMGQMLGYPLEELSRKKWQEVTPAAEIEEIERKIRPLMEGKQDSTRLEKRYIRKDGTTFWADVSVAVMRDDQGKPVHFITTVIDINQRKVAETRLKALSHRQTAILAAVPDIIMEVDRNKVYTWANAAGLEFFGRDVIGREASEYFEGEQTTYESVQPLFNGLEEVIYIESRQRRRDGQKRLLAWWCRVLKDSQGQVLGALSTARDITEQKAVEEKIRQSLKEREVMLREIHHRVKNNIQIVSSLLRLQSRRLDDEKAKSALADSQNRIRSMALIHEKLYQTGDFAQIEMGDYFDSMAVHLLSAYREAAGRVNIQVESRDILLDINRAIPVGLIVNELVTNAVKHAFPGDRDGRILIRLERAEDGKFELAVKDDGIGLPESVLSDGTASFGLEIVRDLTQQIDGSLETRNNGGTEIRIRF
ncbi:MAG: PAS domain S-box protein [Candidatus Aminicenantes bacterium]|nr:PAS domain S-box protein [Candidatus Aminicenantes bacterium]